MSAKIIGENFSPRPMQGQPDVGIEFTCDHCGQIVQIKMTWESARQFVARLNNDIASKMRDLPRNEGPFVLGQLP